MEPSGTKKALLFQLGEGPAKAVSEVLRGQKIAVEHQANLADVRRILESEQFDFLFVGSSYLLKRGAALLPSIKKEQGELSIVICTSREDRERILPLLGAHVVGILCEPYYPKEILFALNAAEKITRAQIKDQAAEELIGNIGNPHRVFIGKSPNAHRVRRETAAAKKGSGHVCFIGENGTGKTQLSLCIHMRPKEIFSPMLLYDPLVDPQRKRGVLSLLEEMTPSGALIIKNTQHLPARDVSVLDAVLRKGWEGRGKIPRLILHHDPSQKIGERFDRSLFPHKVEIPPLRERPEDIGAIFGYYVNSFSTLLHTPPVGVTPAARKMLMRYRWPKNVRELIGVVVFSMVAGTGGSVDPLMLPEFITKDDPDPLERISLENLLVSKLKPIVSKMDLDRVEGLYNIVIARVEAPLIKMVLEMTGRNQSKAAKILGLNRNTLKKKIDEYRIGR